MRDKGCDKTLTAGDKGAVKSVQRQVQLLQEAWTRLPKTALEEQTQGSTRRAQQGSRSLKLDYHSKRKGQSLLEKTELWNEESKGEKCQDSLRSK